MKSKIQILVEEFHKKKGHLIGEMFNKEDALFRIRLITEELSELIRAADLMNYVEFVDALGDLEYVVNGTAVTFGIHLQSIVEEIHSSNMTKGRNIDGKPIKDKEFKKPDIARVLVMTAQPEA